MPRTKTKDGCFFNCFMDQGAYEMLTRFCEESGQSKTRVVELAIRYYVPRLEKLMALADGDTADDSDKLLSEMKLKKAPYVD